MIKKLFTAIFIVGMSFTSVFAASTARISNVMVSPDPYNPTSGLLNLSYSISNSTGAASITAGIYSVENLDVPLKTWQFTKQSNGSNSMTWDGRDTAKIKAPDGSYVYLVQGTDGQNTITAQQANFTVASTTLTQTSCANYKDVKANDPDCPAITYLKTIGAMTGNPDGTFSPKTYLQRDQVMKVILVTFQKFTPQTDYCAGVAPFPDVSTKLWAFQYICRAKQLSIATGYQSGPDQGYYRPSRAVNRIEFLALALRNIKDPMPSNSVTSYNDVALDQWYTGYAKYAYDNGLFNRPNLFPTNPMMRGEVARVLFKLHQLKKI